MVTKKDEGLDLSEESYLKEYVKFLNDNKTTREVGEAIVKDAKKNGFSEYNESEKKAKPGDRVIFNLRDYHAVALAVVGKDEGMRITGAHIDAPALNLKPHPFIESEGDVKLDTHYYGGIMPTDYFSKPLELRGTVVKDGQKKRIKPLDVQAPRLLPHLGGDDGKRKEGEPLLYTGENIDMSTYIPDKKSLLKRMGGIKDTDITRCDFEIVPSAKARVMGSGNSRVVEAYGQDDRSCSFAQLKAIEDVKVPDYTSIAVFYDKEEIGSNGYSGAQGKFLDNVINKTLSLKLGKGLDKITEAYKQAKVFTESRCISSDVNAAFDSKYADKFDPQNAAHLGKGTALTWYTGSKGQYDASKASAEYMDEVKSLFEKNGVKYQEALLGGKLDIGGGGTIAKYVAQMGIETVDLGVPLQGMHTLAEVTNVRDNFEQYKANKTFLKAKR